MGGWGVLESQLVPSGHRKYGGIRLPEFLNNEDAFFGFIGKKPVPAGAGGEVVKRKEIVLKEEMGYVDKIIDFIGRHKKALAAAGLVLLVGGVAYASSDTAKKTVDKNYEKGSKFVKEKYANAFAPAPAVVVPAANESAVATPQVAETPYLMYDGIKVIGDEQFQRDNAMWLEFAKKYSLPDYEFIKSNNKWIDSSDVIPAAAAGGNGFTWNKEFLRGLIENKGIISASAAAAHESGHNNVFNTDRMNETYAQSLAKKALNNLSFVNQSEIEKFYREFNFSQLKT